MPSSRRGRPRPRDLLGRPLTDLRVSVTDRCNLRCPYCMPRKAFSRETAFLPRHEILSYEEIFRLIEAAVDLGVDKVRLTGGEPLLRRDVSALIAMLRAAHPDLELGLTTNGVLLEKGVEELAAAGLDRVTVSLDAVDPEIARRAADSNVDVDVVIGGIEAAVAAGLTPVKINVAVVRGLNDSQILPIIDRFNVPGVIVRLIEFMDVGSTNNWSPDLVVSALEMRRLIEAEYQLERLPATRPGEVAQRYRLSGGGEVGIIASVTEPFCRDCSRARLTANGVFYTCLFATTGTDLRAPLRGGASDDELRELIANVWQKRNDRYSEQREELVALGAPGNDRVEMSRIGG